MAGSYGVIGGSLPSSSISRLSVRLRSRRARRRASRSNPSVGGEPAPQVDVRGLVRLRLPACSGAWRARRPTSMCRVPSAIQRWWDAIAKPTSARGMAIDCQLAVLVDLLGERVPRLADVRGRRGEDPVVVDGERLGVGMAVELLQVGHDRLVRDEVAIDGEVGVGAGVVLARLEQGALGEQVRVDVLGQLDQHMRLARLGRALRKPQHVAVVELEVPGRERVGLVAGVLEQLQERQEQGVVGLVAVPLERRLARPPWPRRPRGRTPRGTCRRSP